MKISGVNLGGWLTLEPFITPELYEPFFGTGGKEAIDEWTLCENLGIKRDEVLELHYATFIVSPPSSPLFLMRQ